MTGFSFFALLFAGLSGHAIAGSITHVANGDCQGLNNAVASATPDGQTTIVLARNGTYNACALSVSHGNVLVEGSGATIGTHQCVATLVATGPGSQLTLRNTRIDTADCGSPLPGPETAVISNAGSMELDSVAFTAPLMRNDSGSTLILRNVTMFGSIKNAGALSIFNSTMVPVGIETDAGSQLNLSNSILWLMSGGRSFSPRCPVSGSGNSHSLGGNVLGWGCAWAAASDRISVGYPQFANRMTDNGGLVPTSALGSWEFHARGIGVARYCEATDARGETRLPGACDAGAYEFDGGSRQVSAGGMNGTFYDSAADGHYVTLQRLHDNDVLVIWNTFDRNGDPAWIYGVGKIANNRIHVDMSQNTGGRLQPGGPATGSHANPWGTVDIDLANCLAGTFRYQSTLSTFGSGEFPLDRLVSFADVGCVD